MPKCSECKTVFDLKRSLESHWRESHPSELETPEEHLGGPESEQRDFEGNEPDDSDYNPQYMIDEKEPPETEHVGLESFTDSGDNDD